MKSKLIFIGIMLFAEISFSQYYSKYFAKANLNSDNILDEIKLSGDDTDYTLSINSILIKGKFDVEGMTGFEIIDIGKNDLFQEIVIHASGPSDDDV